MILVDSNVIINSTKTEYDSLLEFLSENELCVSVITRIEVLGYHKLPESIKSTLENFFSSSPTFEISYEVVDKAIELRQLRKIGLGDAIVAATALVNGLELATSNTKDFKWINSLSLIDPLKD